ncbi:hypothetical protein BO1005MUT1_490078 [Hyphomicrobiales bacterium]|nr:hypothetical protein BO1005MUT1_490078 [Hyphomicrobiales bacterium]
MGMCSYCLRREQYECFGWAEARVCGISGPNDPVRLQRKADLDKARAFALRLEADELERSTAEKVASLRAEANRLEPRI